jgi:hypothetical protein
VATVVLQSNLGHQHPELRWLHFVADQPSLLDPWLEVRHAGWHLLYLLGLVVLAGALAVGRHGFPRPLTAVVAAAVAAVLVSGWVQTRPPTTAQVAAVVDRLEWPQAHQVCERRAGVRYCAYPTYRAWIAEWEVPVQGVLARLPAAARGRELEVGQRVWTSDLDDLHSRVQARLHLARVWRADGAVHPGLMWFIRDRIGDNTQLPRAQLALGYQAAAWAVGLPPASAWPPRACDAGGQARVVAAIWLAGRGADVVAAARLLDLPAERVAAVVAARWPRLLDPATPAAELLGALGVPAPEAGKPTAEAPPCPS